MKNHTHKTNSLLKYSTIFLLGMSVLYFASAYTSINTSLTNATQYIQKIILTSDGTQSGTTGIVLDGSNGNMILSGGLIFTNDAGFSSPGSNISSLSDNLTIKGRYGLSLNAGEKETTSTINILTSDGNGANPVIYFQTHITGNDINDRGRISFHQYYPSAGELTSTRRYEISSYGEHHWYTSTGNDWIGIERMTIKDNGNVGIGISDPTDNKLQIDGNITSYGFITRGTGVVASGLESTAIGRRTNAYGNRSIAMGEFTFSKGVASISMGSMTMASGDFSTSMGFGTDAVGQASTAMGYMAQANGSSSTAMGMETRANAARSTVIGKYNIGLSNSIFEIGIGESSGSRFNALTVLNDGKVGIGTTSPNALLTVEGGIRPIKVTSDPCVDTSNYAEGTMFYNDTSNYFCFCDNTTTAKQMHSPATNCF